VRPLPPALEMLAASGRLVGRRSELTELERCRADAEGGAPRLSVITGEPGIGKSRLVAELAVAAHGEGSEVLYGRGDPAASTPYHGFVQALGRAADPMPWPEPLSSATASVEARYELFEAVRGWLEARSGDHPVLLVLEDVGGSEHATLALCRHLLRSAANGMVLVLTSAEGDLLEQGPLADQAADQPETVSLISLEPFDVEEVVELLEALSVDAEPLAGSVPVDVAWESTAGIPLLVVQMARQAQERDEPPPAGLTVDGSTLEMPSTPVDRLSWEAQRLLEAATVAGPIFGLAVAAEAAGLSEPIALDAAEEACRVGVLYEEAPGSSAFGFGHELMRRVVSERLSSARQLQLHRHVADALLERHGSALGPAVSRIAYHLAQAAGERPSLAAAAFAARAGRTALGMLAWEEASSHFEQGLARVPAGHVQDRFDLLVDLGRARRLGGHPDAAQSAFSEALDLARQASEARWLGMTALVMADRPADIRDDLSGMLELLREVVTVAPPDDELLRLGALTRLAFAARWSNQPDADVVAQEAVDLARRTGDPGVLVETLFWCSLAMVPFLTQDTNSLLGRFVKVGVEATHPDLRFRAGSLAFAHALQQADCSAARAVLDGLRGLADELGWPTLHFGVQKLEGDLWLAEGQVPEARGRADDLLAWSEQAESPRLHQLARVLVASVRRQEGRLAELVPWVDRPEAPGTALPCSRALRLEVLTAADRVEDLGSELAALVDDDLAQLAPAEQPHSWAMLSRPSEVLGDGGTAAALAERLRPYAGLVLYSPDAGWLGPVDAYLDVLDSLQGSDPPDRSEDPAVDDPQSVATA
jgi:hypothetical protein